MSRAQGDAYKTWTDHKLNAYKARLDAKLRKLIDHKEKWYRAGAGWILCQERNRMTNPNGSWKWNGWEIESHEYWITVFPEECVEIKNGEPTAIGWSQVVKVIDDDKEAANEFFTKAAFFYCRLHRSSGCVDCELDAACWKDILLQYDEGGEDEHYWKENSYDSFYDLHLNSSSSSMVI